MAGTPRVDPIDSRVALRAYALLVGLAGFVVLGWGQVWLGDDLGDIRWGRAALIRVGGALMMATAVVAAGLSSLDARPRTRALSWFIAAHAVVWLVALGQSVAVLGDLALPRQLSWAMLMVILALLYVRFSASTAATRPLSIRDTAPAAGTADPAGAHERQIRDAAAQEERNRLARDLHDAVKQQIFAIQTSAATAEARFDSDPAGARDALAQVRQSAREASSEMEALLDQLRVTPIGTTGLVEAIRKQCDALSFRSGAEVSLRVGELPRDEAFAPGAHQAIFRVVQEALANTGRHARARRVAVSLDATPQCVVATIEDDGVGLPEGRPRSGMGIQNMRARAAELGGGIDIAPAAGGGTVVTLSVPYETRDAVAHQRKQARGFAILFGLCAALTLLDVWRRGFGGSNVFVLFFTVAFVHHLKGWRRS